MLRVLSRDLINHVSWLDYNWFNITTALLQVKTRFLTAGLVLDQRKRTVLLNILLGLFFIFCFSTIISKCHMTVFSVFESSLLDPNKLNRILEQFIIVTVAIFLHLWNSLKKKLWRTQLAITPWRAQLRTFIFRACLHGGGGGGLSHLPGVPLGKLGPGPY